MLLVAFLWSISSTADKITVGNSSPLFYALIVNAFIAIFLLPIAIAKAKNTFTKDLIIEGSHLLILGTFLALSFAAQMIAIDHSQASYVIAIKRTSVLLSVTYGFFLFKERDVRNRLIGSCFLVIGAMLISPFS